MPLQQLHLKMNWHRLFTCQDLITCPEAPVLLFEELMKSLTEQPCRNCFRAFKCWWFHQFHAIQRCAALLVYQRWPLFGDAHYFCLVTYTTLNICECKLLELSFFKVQLLRQGFSVGWINVSLLSMHTHKNRDICINIKGTSCHASNAHFEQIITYRATMLRLRIFNLKWQNPHPSIKTVLLQIKWIHHKHAE